MANKKIFQFLAIFAALLSFSSCEKECESCTLFLINQEAYQYSVSIDGQSAFTLKPAETKTFEILSGKSYTITGDLNSPFAHNDFLGYVRCNGSCGVISLILKE